MNPPRAVVRDKGSARFSPVTKGYSAQGAPSDIKKGKLGVETGGSNDANATGGLARNCSVRSAGVGLRGGKRRRRAQSRDRPDHQLGEPAGDAWHAGRNLPKARARAADVRDAGR